MREIGETLYRANVARNLRERNTVAWLRRGYDLADITRNRGGRSTPASVLRDIEAMQRRSYSS